MVDVVNELAGHLVLSEMVYADELVLISQTFAGLRNELKMECGF